jgi:hypothetical protein
MFFFGTNPTAFHAFNLCLFAVYFNDAISNSHNAISDNWIVVNSGIEGNGRFRESVLILLFLLIF